jgi:hypothetical protein
MWFRRQARAEADFSIFLPSVSHVLFARSIGCGETHELPRQRVVGRDKDMQSTNEQTKNMAVMVATAVVLMVAHMARGLRRSIPLSQSSAGQSSTSPRRSLFQSSRSLLDRRNVTVAEYSRSLQGRRRAYDAVHRRPDVWSRRSGVPSGRVT